MKVNVTKNLIGMEDLLLGTGFATQQRGPSGTAPVNITRINGSIFPYDDTKTMKQKFDVLEARMDTLPVVVDQDGNLLTGYINSSVQDLNLTGRLWRKDFGLTAAIYYGQELMFEYDKVLGNLVIPADTNYIAGDNAVRSEFQAADTIINTTLTNLTSSLKGGAFLEANNGPSELVKLDTLGRLPALDGSQLTNINIIPIGATIMVFHAGVEANWLDCDGSAISRSTYGELFAKIGITYGPGDGSTTFNLPDMRAMFPRGLDAGKAIDTGRTLGSTQDDSVKAHTHLAGTLVASSNGGHTHTVEREGSGQGGQRPAAANIDVNKVPLTLNTSNAGAHTHTITGATASEGGAETRPKNIAVRFLIRVK